MISPARPNGATYRVHDEPEDADSAGRESEASRHVPDPLGPLRENLRLLAEQASHYLSLRRDQLKLKVRSALLFTALGLLGGLVALSGLVVACALLLNGIALGIAALLGDRLWAGQLITGGGVLLAAMAGVYLILQHLTESSRQRTARKYERLQHERRAAVERRDTASRGAT